MNSITTEDIARMLPQITVAAQRVSQVKLQQMLIAGRELFFRHGFSATSMEAVAKEATVGKATLYEYFPNKVELLRAIITIELDMRADHLVFEAAAPGQLRSVLARFAHGVMDLLLSPANIAIYRIIFAETPRHPEIGRLFYENGPARLISRISDYMAGLMEDGRLMHGNPRLAATQFIGLIRTDLQTRSMLAVDEATLQAEKVMTVECGVDVFLRGYAR